MKNNILSWCDEKITELKTHGINFENGVAKLPNYAVYDAPVAMISTFTYRNDIPNDLKASSLLCYFMPDINLFRRIDKFEEDFAIITEYGGVCGFDLSPSIGMLRPRQRMSILINSIFNALLAIRGVKILPNCRIGDIKTQTMVNSFPDKVSFISGMHGCKKYGFSEYGLYQLMLSVKSKRPPVLYIYGTMSIKEAKKLFWNENFKVITFPDRRNRVRNGSKAYVIYYENGTFHKQIYDYKQMGGVA